MVFNFSNDDIDLALEWKNPEGLSEVGVMHATITDFEVLKGNVCLWWMEEKMKNTKNNWRNRISVNVILHKTYEE
jgi:hypothetical protein